MLLLVRQLPAEAAERTFPRFTDQAGLLSGEEAAELTEQLNRISEERNCDVVVVTAEGLEGKTATEYADDFYDQNGYGMGRERDGILLLISMEARDWAISTRGYGIQIFTDAGQEYMTEQFLPYLSDGKYADAFRTFADLCEDFIAQADNGEPYDVGNLPKKSYRNYIPFWIAGSFLIAFFLAWGMALMQKSKLKTIHSNETADEYEKEGSLSFSRKEDIFIRQQVISRKIDYDTNSGGGSSTHTSSSGATHGGSSGKF